MQRSPDRAKELNQELEKMVLGQEKEAYWIMAKSIRGLWELVDVEFDRDTATKRGQRIANFNPGTETAVLLLVAVNLTQKEGP